jgi:hypothetical protein
LIKQNEVYKNELKGMEDEVAALKKLVEQLINK